MDEADKDAGADRERWGVGASLWKAIGGERIAAWWRDFLLDPLGSPVWVAGASREEIGRLGEDLAAGYLRQQAGTHVLWRNFRAPRGGEVDLVCRERDVLVFVEVKTRTSTAFARPLDAVDVEKQRLIARGALEWMRLLDKPEVIYRFDVMEVVLREGQRPELLQVKNAFQLPEGRGDTR